MSISYLIVYISYSLYGTELYKDMYLSENTLVVSISIYFIGFRVYYGNGALKHVMSRGCTSDA